MHTDSKENDGQDDIQFNQNALSVIGQLAPESSQKPPTPLVSYPGLHFDPLYFLRLGMSENTAVANKTINRRYSAVNLPPMQPPVAFMSPAARPTTSWTKYNSNANQPNYNFNHNHSILYDNHQEEDMVIDDARPSPRQADSSRVSSVIGLGSRTSTNQPSEAEKVRIAVSVTEPRKKETSNTLAQ